MHNYDSKHIGEVIEIAMLASLLHTCARTHSEMRAGVVAPIDRAPKYQVIGPILKPDVALDHRVELPFKERSQVK